ncbi:MAG TPA: hypothetical protein VLU46_05865 [Thermoanaerobaculia bacterium]|nr:hypothetical protein [Thermoanaerobaculia bacterium]
MHLDPSGVVRRELQKRVAFAADGQDDPVVLQLGRSALDLLAARLEALQTLMDVGDRQQPAAALAEEINDRFVEF